MGDTGFCRVRGVVSFGSNSRRDKGPNRSRVNVFSGQGLEYNKISAHKCYNIAASKGSVSAQKHKDSIEKKMNSAEILRTQ